MHIPFVDLKLQYESIRKEIDEAAAGIFSGGQFIGGEPVKEFETAFAKPYGVKHCIGTGNGTDALFTILKALNIGAGDEVITPAFSCIASAEVITLTGATVVFADVDPLFYAIDPKEVAKKITTKTKVVIAVHLYGQAAPIKELKKICDNHNLHLIEDCAQAHLTEENGSLVGTFGVAAAFSFYPTKNLGAYGDAGCILTQDDALAEKMRRWANHGALGKNDHTFEGTNSRLDTLQAAILSIKLKHLEKWNDRRIAISNQYNVLLKNIEGVSTPAIRKNSKHTFHIYAIRTKKRNELKKYLATNGIDTLIHYPEGLPYTKAYHYKKHTAQDYPVTFHLQHELLSIPVFPELTDEQVTSVATFIRNYFSR